MATRRACAGGTILTSARQPLVLLPTGAVFFGSLAELAEQKKVGRTPHAAVLAHAACGVMPQLRMAAVAFPWRGGPRTRGWRVKWLLGGRQRRRSSCMCTSARTPAVTRDRARARAMVVFFASSSQWFSMSTSHMIAAASAAARTKRAAVRCPLAAEELLAGAYVTRRSSLQLWRRICRNSRLHSTTITRTS